MNRKPWLVAHLFFAFTAAVALALLSTSCASTSPKKVTATPTLPPAPTSTFTTSPTFTETHTNTFTNTPSFTNTNTPAPTNTNAPTLACATPFCTPTSGTGHVLSGAAGIVPMLTPQTHGPVSFSANEWYRYDFCAQTGTTYTFSTCAADGGSYADDTYFRLYDTATCAFLTSNDDFCALGSKIMWMSTLTGPVFLQVHNYSWGAETYTIAYWRN